MLLWTDLETCGLKPLRHEVLEIAMVLTDDQLRPLAEFHSLFYPESWPHCLNTADEFVQEMHIQSGLVHDITTQARPQLRPPLVWDAAMEWVKATVPEPKSVPMAGSTIGFDRKFLDIHCPDLNEMVHHRSVDVSTVKELVRRWVGPHAVYAGPHTKAHRARSDIADSISELKHYKGMLFT